MMNKIQVGRKYEKELRINASATERQFRKLLQQVKKAYKLKCRVSFQKGWYKDEAFYISDFYFPETKATIELDGSSHDRLCQKIQDEKKADYLKSIGVRTYRLENRQVWAMTPDRLMQYLLRNRIV